jgi:hypothetical protein
MMRTCSHCGKEFSPQELSREDTEGLEAERKSLGLEGLLFRYYTCSACNYADIFVDVHPLEGEPEEVFSRRRDELEATIKQLEGEGVKVVVRAGMRAGQVHFRLFAAFVWPQVRFSLWEAQMFRGSTRISAEKPGFSQKPGFC